ncbi:hypothetical protein FACS1894179_00400 [Bacteroidia bacterium]|nr:hypothetical protein FACS1894179_00400 [Bacteroidia bacterium]
MNKLKNIFYILGLSLMIILPGCSEPDDEITSIDYDRLFTPSDLKLQIANRTNVLLTWSSVKNAESYTIEVFANGDLNFEGTPVMTLDGITANGTVTNPYTITGLDGETSYSIRIKAVGASISDSKWASGTVKTNAEQIFQPIDPEELKATEVTLRWSAGQVGTEIILTPGDIKHTVTATEIAAGAATITGLTGDTKYTAVMKNGTKTRGTIEFTTLLDLGSATAIEEGDNLAAILDAANEGDEFVIISGTFSLGTYQITKSVKISGYKPSDKPIIYGQLTCGSSVNSLELKSLTFRGDEDPTIAKLSQFFNILSGCDLKTLSIDDCDISNYKDQLIYNNTAGKIGSFTITNSLIHNIEGSGGDGIDLRGGTLGSMTVQNTTFYNGFRTFLRMQATAGAISFTNCTFYKISNYDNTNNHGLFRINAGSTFQVKNCLLVETGNATTTVTTAGNFCRQASNMVATTNYSTNVYYNCYQLWVGLYTNPTQCSATELNPQFADAANGDFTVGNVMVTAGDPRWIK